MNKICDSIMSIPRTH